MRGLPWRDRPLGMWAGRVAAALLLLALGGSAVALMSPTRPPPEGEILVVEVDDARNLTESWFELSSADWKAQPLEARRTTTRSVPGALSLKNSGISVMPGGMIGFEAPVQGPRGASSEAMLLPRNGPPIQLTDDPGDDNLPYPSPDGTHAVLTTGRFDTLTHHAAPGIVNLATREVRRLTQSTEIQVGPPQWSRDGSRIAFIRLYQRKLAPALCVIAVDGSDEHCVTPALRFMRALLAWDGSDQLLVTLDSAGVEQLARLRITDGSVTIVDPAHAMTRVASPGAKWTACLCRRGNSAELRWYVHPTARPDLVRMMPQARGGGHPRFAFGDPHAGAEHIARLEIAALDSARPGLRVQLRASAFNGQGIEVGTPYLRWRSLDTAVAAVSEAGLMLPRRAGDARIVASAGGWRADTLTIRVGASRMRSVLDERWERLDAEWLPYGEPKPSIVAADRWRAMLSNGDGNYTSGLFSRRQVGARGGFGVSAWISSPVTRPQWQVISINALADVSSERMKTVTLPTGSLDGGQPSLLFSVGLPAGETIPGVERLYFSASEEYRTIDAKPLLDGRWWEVRVQCLMDGRCAGAVNGFVVWRSESPSALPDSARIQVVGNSVASRMLVGPLRVWEGIHDDIDWEMPLVSVDEALRRGRR
jgi:hypothetical protein